MTQEIPREQWGRFCDDISREKMEWETSIQVLSVETGAQVLSEGLPLLGISFDVEGGRNKIELITGTGGGIHHTHSIFDPCVLMLQNEKAESGWILDIEDDAGTKTLVEFRNPPMVPAVRQGSGIAVVN
jgi:hypothetical protein